MGYKLRYEIDLTRPPLRAVALDGHTVRSIASGDLDGLARLMLDAFAGTIDSEDEDLDDARTRPKDIPLTQRVPLSVV